MDERTTGWTAPCAEAADFFAPGRAPQAGPGGGQARRLCAACPPRVPGLRPPHREYGFWGGESEEERHRAGFTVARRSASARRLSRPTSTPASRRASGRPAAPAPATPVHPRRSVLGDGCRTLPPRRSPSSGPSASPWSTSRPTACRTGAIACSRSPSSPSTPTAPSLDRWSTLRAAPLRAGRAHPHPRPHGGRAAPAPTFAQVAPELLASGSTVPSSPPTTPSSTGASSPSPCVGPATARPTPPASAPCACRGPSPPSPPRTAWSTCATATASPSPSAHDALADAEATAAVLPLLLADGGLATADDLAPHLTGGTGGEPARWPAWTPPSWWRRALYG